MTTLFRLFSAEKRTSKAVISVPQKPSFAYLEGRAPYLESRACVLQKPCVRTLKAVPAYLKSRAFYWAFSGAGNCGVDGARVT